MTAPTSVRLLLAVLALTVFSLGCDSGGDTEAPPPPPPSPTTGTVQGRVSLPSGASGTIGNTRIAVYSSFDDWGADRTLRTVSSDSDGNYALADLSPGSYYFDAWKDNDNNGGFSAGDFFGVYVSSGSVTVNSSPSPVEVRAGETITLNFNLFILP